MAVHLQRKTIQVQGSERSYWLAPAADPDAPLLLAVHGSGISGTVMAEWTGLATRGPAAGFTTVFPDGCREIWDDTGAGRVDGMDDAAFIAALVDLLQEMRSPRRKVVLLGLSNGATFVERVARNAVVAIDGLILVAGTARVAGRRTKPVPQQSTDVLMILGSADRLVPWAGGRATGWLAWYARRRARRVIRDDEGREVIGAETLAGDWAAVNGCHSEPRVEHLDGKDVDRLTWTAPGCHAVTLYKLIGAGHGWPGWRQYLPAWLVGRIPQGFDATAASLEFAAKLVSAR